VDERERTGDGVERRVDGRMSAAGGLELREGAAKVAECHIGVGRDLAAALDLMERAHRLGDRRGEIDEVAWHARVSL
jgi:hypothetical protein